MSRILQFGGKCVCLYVWGGEVQAIGCKIGYKDILYITGNIANILQ